MLRTTISTKSPETKAEMQIPPDLLASVKRATEILESELGELADKCEMVAKWHFGNWSDSEEVSVAHLSLTANGHLVGNLTFPPGTLKNDETIRRNLHPFLTEVGRHLSGLVKHRLNVLRKQLEEDLEALAALAKE
ncbi:MAG: hypothetical protein J0I06_26220 [Planctomycetes bacterium]|nr:hypothetical protein [Planctomycetota bacterium]